MDRDAGTARGTGDGESPATEHGTRRTNRTRAGRPARISREAIITESLTLLRNCSVEQFTLAGVARRLGTVPMALYNYFPSREALLAEAANEVCKQFYMAEPAPEQDWKEILSDWIWTLHELTSRYPMMIKITGLDGKTAAGWLRITHVVNKTLYNLGFRGKELALTAWLFCAHALSLLQIEVSGVDYHSPITLTHADELDPQQQELFQMLRPQYESISPEDVLQEGLADLLAAVERRMPKHTNRP